MPPFAKRQNLGSLPSTHTLKISQHFTWSPVRTGLKGLDCAVQVSLFSGEVIPSRSDTQRTKWKPFQSRIAWDMLSCTLVKSYQCNLLYVKERKTQIHCHTQPWPAMGCRSRRLYLRTQGRLHHISMVSSLPFFTQCALCLETINCKCCHHR